MKPHKMYSKSIDPNALDQFYTVMKWPETIRGALMPDAHLGYTLPIGGVVLMKDTVFASLVGFDIGCGVCALKTSFNKEEVIAHSSQIYDRILQHVPVGFNHRKTALGWTNKPPITAQGVKIFNDKGGYKQLGTLGGGNHFIEIGYDENDSVWIIIHSGSRGVGHGIASHYMKLASGGDKAKEGHYGFDINSQDGKDYLLDMKFCLEFALTNRRRMLMHIDASLRYLLKDGAADWSTLINRTHNHAEVTDEGIIHRKGATHANLGMLGVVPGNMRDGSFIVRGLGSTDSLCSSSHGAGRVLGRNQAKKTLCQDEFDKSMVNVVCKTSGRLDEAPGAYKNIFDVMELQSDLVEVVAHVRPIINVKG